MTLSIILVMAALVIVIALSLYAGSLLSKLNQQKNLLAEQQAQQQQIIEQRNSGIAESIRLIAKAVVEQQCELSEAAIRICRLLETYHQVDDAHYPEQFPQLHQLDQRLAAYPTHQAYKALKRQERMRFDVNRAQWEIDLKDSINQECASLLTFGQ